MLDTVSAIWLTERYSALSWYQIALVFLFTSDNNSLANWMNSMFRIYHRSQFTPDNRLYFNQIYMLVVLLTSKALEFISLSYINCEHISCFIYSNLVFHLHIQIPLYRILFGQIGIYVNYIVFKNFDQENASFL